MKYRLLIAITCFTISLSAQENVSFAQKKETVSPEIHPDNSVTFRLEASDAKSVKVQGDFLPAQGFSPGSAELKKDANGIWSFTTGKLPS